MKSSYKYFVNFSGFAIKLGSRCKYQINDYRGVFRTQSKIYDRAFFREGLRAIKYYCKKASS